MITVVQLPSMCVHTSLSIFFFNLWIIKSWRSNSTSLQALFITSYLVVSCTQTWCKCLFALRLHIFCQVSEYFIQIIVDKDIVGSISHMWMILAFIKSADMKFQADDQFTFMAVWLLCLFVCLIYFYFPSASLFFFFPNCFRSAWHLHDFSEL